MSWRYRMFRRLLTPVSEHFRASRMKLFVETFRPLSHQRVLDVGGQPGIWRHVPVPLHVTLLNLPGVADAIPASHHTFRQVTGDACECLPFQEDEFDFIYSNSVLEHVGEHQRQQMFAAQIRRFQANYWVQTPAKWFPFEAHTGMPFWWFYPGGIRRWFINRWQERLPAWSSMIAHTTVISLDQIKRLFPDARYYVERFAGFPKSYIAFRVANNTF